MIIIQIAQAETLPTDENIFIGLPKEGIEKVGFGLWWRSCSIFYLEVSGGAVLIRKIVVEGTQFQSKFRSRIPSFQSARSS